MIQFDTETCGLCGPAVILQYYDTNIHGAKITNNDNIVIYNLWKNPAKETLKLIEYICSQEILGFNLTFDWFQLSKIYNMFKYYSETIGSDFIPEQCIQDLWLIEHCAREYCLKPKAACDLMLVSRKGPFQSLMERKPIRIRKIPTQLCYPLIRELEKIIDLPDIYFLRNSHKKMSWSITDIKDRSDVKNLVLNFAPSGKLKTIHEYLFNQGKITFDEVKLPDTYLPEELPYAPYGGTWNRVIGVHINWWEVNVKARQYARQDVKYLNDLYHHPEFNEPTPGDKDSDLACLVGTVRWSGLEININQLKELKRGLVKQRVTVPTASKQVWSYIEEYLDPIEKVILNGSTSKRNLEPLATREGELGDRVRKILDTRQIDARIKIYNKLIKAGVFHPSFVITGTLSNRMSGSDRLNPQGIPRETEVRYCFPLADHDEFDLWGGDFDQFEVVIADAEFKDPKLHEQLKADKKIHALFAMEMFPEETYETIMATKGTKNDLYGKGKNGVFAKIYGGDWNTLVKKYGIEEEVAKSAEQRWDAKYTQMTKRRNEVFSMFATMRQDGGLGTNIQWKEPADYIESFLGFRRYFTLENKIAKALFELARKLPESLRKLKIRVQRYDREQTGHGAVQSALYGAAFQIQSKNMRAGMNHLIQSPGSEINKNVQVSIWSIQPVGCHKFVVKPMNVHDEIMCPVRKGYEDKVKEKVNEAVERYRKYVPLIKFEWLKLQTWADK